MINWLINFLGPAPDEPPYRTPPVPYTPGTESAQWGGDSRSDLDGRPAEVPHRSWWSRLLRRP